jgi:hypothetical protein
MFGKAISLLDILQKPLLAFMNGWPGNLGHNVSLNHELATSTEGLSALFKNRAGPGSKLHQKLRAGRK